MNWEFLRGPAARSRLQHAQELIWGRRLVSWLTQKYMTSVSALIARGECFPWQSEGNLKSQIDLNLSPHVTGPPRREH